MQTLVKVAVSCQEKGVVPKSVMILIFNLKASTTGEEVEPVARWQRPQFEVEIQVLVGGLEERPVLRGCKERSRRQEDQEVTNWSLVSQEQSIDNAVVLKWIWNYLSINEFKSYAVVAA